MPALLVDRVVSPVAVVNVTAYVYEPAAKPAPSVGVTDGPYVGGVVATLVVLTVASGDATVSPPDVTHVKQYRYEPDAKPAPATAVAPGAAPGPPADAVLNGAAGDGNDSPADVVQVYAYR